jgi:plastocyanin
MKPRSLYLPSLLLFAAFLGPKPAVAQQNWQLTVGSQFPDCVWAENNPATALCSSQQGMAFEPNEIWIHAGDSVTWTHRTGEGHTVTFLQPGQIRPSTAVGCSAVTGSANSPNDSSYDPTGSASEQCVNSGTIGNNGDAYTVSFPTAGNYKFTCLIHASMNGTVHVLNASATLPHAQAFYDKQQKVEAGTIYTAPLPLANAALAGPNEVIATGALVGGGGGSGYESVFRFLQPVITIHAGDTVQWINYDPVEPHTITFGCPTDDTTCPTTPGPFAHVNSTGPIALAQDGVWAAEISSPFNPAKSQINSGFLIAASQDVAGAPQTNPPVNKFRLKFDFPGNYRYICELHDELGMVGWVVVLPKL